MSFLSLLNQRAVVSRRPSGGVDAYGLPTEDWQQVWAGSCRAQPAVGDEERSGRETSHVRYKVFLPPEAVVKHTDRIAIDGGVSLDIQNVAVWPGRDGFPHHLEVIVDQEM